MKTPGKCRLNTMNNEDFINNENLVFKYKKQNKKSKKQNMLRNIFPLVTISNKTNEIHEKFSTNNSNNDNNKNDNNINEINKSNFKNSTKTLIIDNSNKNITNNSESLSISKKNIFTKTPISNRNYENNLLKDIDFITASKFYSVNKYNYLNDPNIFLFDNNKKLKILKKNSLYYRNNITNNNKNIINSLIVHFDDIKPINKPDYNDFNCADDLLTQYNNVHNKTTENKFMLKRNIKNLKYNKILRNHTKEKNTKNLNFKKYDNIHYYDSCNKKMDLFKENEEKNNNLSPKKEEAEICRYLEKEKNEIKYHLKSNTSTKNKTSSVIFRIYKPYRKENNNDDIIDLM